MRAERDGHIAANHARAADLVEAIDGNKSRAKLLSAIDDSAARITQLDAEMDAETTAITRLSRIATEARKTDAKLIARQLECKRIREQWNRLDATAAELYPPDDPGRFIQGHRKRNGITPSNKRADERHAWLAEERALLAGDIQRGRFQR